MSADDDYEEMLAKMRQRDEVARGVGRFFVILAVLALIAIGLVVYYYQYEECTRVHPGWYCI